MDKTDLKEIKVIVTEAVKDLPTKADMAEAIKKGVQEGNEEMAQIVVKSLDQMESRINDQFVGVNNQFTEVKDSIAIVEAKVNKALNSEYARLEKRVRVVGGKLGISTPIHR